MIVVVRKRIGHAQVSAINFTGVSDEVAKSNKSVRTARMNSSNAGEAGLSIMDDEGSR
jgi:hypothetical protein